MKRYADSILDPEIELEKARNACIEVLGIDATIQAASIVACFDGINRVADATGIRLDEESVQFGAEEIVSTLEVDDLAAARR